MFTVVEVVSGSPHLQTVKLLWRADSDTLGFMPEGGFDEASRRGELVGLLAASGHLVAYVFFRRTNRGQIAIVHLCVAPTARGNGAARVLIQAVRDRAGGSHELRLRCRRDFVANGMWPKLGFVAVAEARGKARGAILTVWRCELMQLPLLAALGAATQTDGVRVVIDANVFFDLDDAKPHTTESHGLVADWMEDFVDLYVTGEILNEIDRGKDPVERTRQRHRAARFHEVPRQLAVEEAAERVFRRLLPATGRASATSDARQLAMAVAGGMTFFVTRDTDVASIADAAEEQFGLEILAPHEVVSRFDELGRGEAYRPKRVFLGSTVRTAIARADDLESIVELLHHGQQITEPRRHTKGRLKEMIALPSRFAVSLVKRDGALLALHVVDQRAPNMLHVPYFAVSDDSLGKTAAHHYAEHLVTTATRQGHRIVVVENSVRASDALRQAGFSSEAGLGLVKVALAMASDAASVANEAEKLGASCPPARALTGRIAAALRTLNHEKPDPSGPRTDLIALERALWPVKITNTGLPTYVVPIKPRWATDLFDRALAQGTLFGAAPHLVLNSENVYYRAARPAIIAAPGRILWYVSEDKAYPAAMAVRACSYVDEVLIGSAKDLFRRFRRLGIYQWADILELAEEPHADIMAFRFSKTELFVKPVSFGEAQGVLERHTGRRSQFQGPLAIPEACFLDFYQRGEPEAMHGK